MIALGVQLTYLYIAIYIQKNMHYMDSYTLTLLSSL